MDPTLRQSLKDLRALLLHLERSTKISKFVKVCLLIQKRDRSFPRLIKLENLSDLVIDPEVKAPRHYLSKERQGIFIDQAHPNEHRERLQDLQLAGKCAHQVQIVNQVRIDSIINDGWKSST